jgi:acyl carrier protein
MPARFKRIGQPGTQVAVMGGATEVSIHSTIYVPDRTDPSWKSIPYGHPMANQTTYVLDENMEPCAIGVPGELYLGGIGLARGYLGKPAFTAERFVPHPFSADPGARLYRTGDLVRWRTDGELELIGRVDFMVKLRGLRIELGEIESALSRHPSVDRAVAGLVDVGGGDRRIVAYYTALGSSAPREEELVALLADALPEYMVPSHIVRLDELPLTPNGKVNRRALPAPNVSRSEPSQLYVAPRDPLERVLTGLVAQLTGAERVGVEDDFFALGGHSLLAINLIGEVEDVFGVRVPVRDLFGAPSVAGIAAALDSQVSRETLNEIADQVLDVSQMDAEEVARLLGTA